MILLLGGTGETGRIATGLAEAGYSVLVSTATDIPLEVGSHPKIRRRKGELDKEAMAELIREGGIKGVVDCTHPYAQSARGAARNAAEREGIPYITWVRPSALPGDDEILEAADHVEAASLAFSFGRPVFLTIGSRNLAPYAQASRRSGVPVLARVLSHPASIE
ncbi:MAG TPA: precorrin-6A/cobalt-precorrin-6A reductase, partial [Thermodesulfobacteriota bacterium]|nr:precorrin-6A/cobalt-precorrin-6A reductase [Thermodesulfobacteriota bacterium]